VHNYLCKTCFDLVELIDMKERCERCVREMHFDGCKVCPYCKTRGGSWKAALFDREGPIPSILSISSRGFIRAMAAFFYCQIERLGWPEPEIIIPNAKKGLLVEICLELAKFFGAVSFSPWAASCELKLTHVKMMHRVLHQKKVLCIGKSVRELDKWRRELVPFQCKSLMSMAILAR